MITITELATAPQLDSRRVARDLIDWLKARDYHIIKAYLPPPVEPEPRPELPFSASMPTELVTTDKPGSSRYIWPDDAEREVVTEPPCA